MKYEAWSIRLSVHVVPSNCSCNALLHMCSYKNCGFVSCVMFCQQCSAYQWFVCVLEECRKLQLLCSVDWCVQVERKYFLLLFRGMCLFVQCSDKCYMKAYVCSALAVCSYSQILAAANNTSAEHEAGEPPTSLCMGSCFSWLWLDNTACSESHVLHCSN